MSRPKVLFLGGGRRVALAERFIAKGCDVLGYESSRDVPLADVATVFQGRRWQDQRVHEDLYGICRQHHVSAVVPLQDEAVELLAGIDNPAVRKVCSPLGAAQLAFNKAKFAEFCEAKFPEYYPSPRSGEPYVTKPAFGFGSRGVERCDWYPYLSESPIPAGMVAQLELPEPEYTADAYWNRDGKFIGSCVRERLRVAGGEVVEAEVVWDDAIDNAVFELGTAMGLRGPACFQFRYDPNGSDPEVPQVIECNARFGGGSTLSCEAGLDMVDYVVREHVLSKEVTPSEPVIHTGMKLTRSFRDHFHRFVPAVPA